MDLLQAPVQLCTLSATWSHHGQMLQCQAINKDDHPGISVSVLLDIKGKNFIVCTCK